MAMKAHLTNTFRNGWNWIFEIILLYFTLYLLITIFCIAYALNFLFSGPTYICRLVGKIIILMQRHFHFLPFCHIFLVIWRRAFWHSLCRRSKHVTSGNVVWTTHTQPLASIAHFSFDTSRVERHSESTRSSICQTTHAKWEFL